MWFRQLIAVRGTIQEILHFGKNNSFVNALSIGKPLRETPYLPKIMKHLVQLTVALCLTCGSAYAAESQVATNTVSGKLVMPSVPAPEFKQMVQVPLSAWPLTNGPILGNSQLRLGILPKEIQLTQSGCEATWGRHKAAFETDLASERPIQVTMPDGKNIAFRPTFLVLANRVTGEQLLIAEITNRTVQVFQPDRLVWTDAFDRSGPQIDIEYHYSASGLEQNVIFRENPLKNLPLEWKIEDVAVELWTEAFFEFAPTTIQTKTAEIRAESISAKALHAADQDIGWDSMRIVAGGRAFNVGPISKAAATGNINESNVERDSLPVSKIWTEVEDGGIRRTFIIETLDALAAKPKLDALKEGRHASVGKPASGRSELLRLHASASSPQIRKDNRQAINSPSRQKTISARAESATVITLKGISEKPGFVMDFAIVNVVPVPPGIVSWWPAGGNAKDAITNHNDGTLYGSPTYAFGKVGQAFGFAQTTDYIQVSNAPSLNPTNALTIDAWVYLTASGGNQFLVGKDGQTANRQFLLTVSPSGTFRAHVGITNGNFYYIDSNIHPTTQAWYYVAMTYSAANSNLSLYVNGSLDTNGAVSGSTITTAEPVFFGHQPNSGSYWWGYQSGVRLDEIDIFNRALSATEIQAIYDAGAAGKVNPNCVPPSTNAVAWWPADGNAYDIVHTNHGTLQNGAGYGPGMVGQAFSLDGANDYVRVENGPDLNPTNAVTLESWVYLNNYATGSGYNNAAIIRKDGECSARQYLLSASPNGTFRAHIGITNVGYYYVDSSVTPQNQTWYHVAETYNGTNLCIYVNGVLAGSTPVSGRIITTTQPLCIGGSANGCWDYFVNGFIDEPTIYNRALSATEISAIYSAGTAGKCACYLTNQFFTCIVPANMSFGPLVLTNSIFCLGNPFVASVIATSIDGTVRQTLQYSDCNTAYVDSSFSPTVASNWFVLTAPDGSTVSSNSLAVTFNPGMAGIWDLTFNVTYTNAFSPCTDPITISYSTNISVVDLASLDVSGYGPITDDGITRTYVVCQDSLLTNVTVTAISNPSLGQSNLPPCWTMVGGSGTSQFTRTVNVSQVGTNIISCTSPYSIFTNIIIVANHTDSDYDGVGDCEEIINGTNPHDASSTVQMRLGYWKFNDTNTWAGEQGQIPLLATNISAVTNWSEFAAEVASSGAALVYRTEESTGIANILCARGTVRFWFSPEWSSASAGGSGPGLAGRFADVGHWTSDGSYGWWSLAITPNGNSLQFITQGDSATTTNLQANISWMPGQWHQVALIYTSTNTSIFVDGQPLNTNGLGITHYPNATARAGGFGIGATAFGTNQIKGLFDEFETFNFPLDAQSISNDYIASRPFLSPPTVTLDPTNDGTGLNLSITHSRAIELDSTSDTNSFPNPVQFLVETNYSDSWFAREPSHFDSSSVGINITKLATPAVEPAGADFNYPSNVTIVLGAENLTNMVEGIFRSELGRSADSSELSYWSDYAEEFRSFGYTDEEIRLELITYNFRNSSEYISKYGASGDPYIANNNYTIEFCTNTDGPWLTYTGAIQIIQSVTLYSRVSKTTSTDSRTTYAYLTSDTNAVQFTLIPISWLTQYFGTNYITNTNALPYADPDHDRLQNWQEYAIGTNPHDSDTDYDGRRDGDEVVDETDPLNPNSFLGVNLGGWSFDITNTWVGSQGQLPILVSNVQAVASWSGSAVQVDSTNFATLAFASSDITNGPNINCRRGTIQFWFSPNWSSGVTNGGPGTQARLIEVGSETGTNGWFALVLSANGASLSFVTRSNTFGVTNLTVAINWASNEWHQIALTHDPTNSSIYVDGQPLATNGLGAFYFPDASARSAGFTIGSTKAGVNQARGRFDELQTFNYPLVSDDVATIYKSATSIDIDGDGLPDWWEFRYFGNVSSGDPNGDADGDYLTNLEEYRAGTNPKIADTDGDGRTDWQEVKDGTDPLNSASKATWPVVADQPYTPTGSPPGLRVFTQSGNTYFVLETGDPNLKYDLYGTDDNNTFYWMGRLQMNVRSILIDPSKARTTYRLDTPGTSANYHYDLLNRLQDKDSHPAYNYDNEGNIQTITP
jgi:hypothetical protein